MKKLNDKDLAWADCAFISGMVVQRDSAREIIARCKEANLKIIADVPWDDFLREKMIATEKELQEEREATIG